MKYYKSLTSGFIYSGDLIPGDREATGEEVNEYIKKIHAYPLKRMAAYPDFRDFIDAEVKIHSGNAELAAEGQQQLAGYIEACLAVKARFPKN